MKRRDLYARSFAGVFGGSLLVAVALAGCPDTAGNCADTLTCVEPAYCFEAGDTQIDGCPNFGTGGQSDVQED